MKYTELTRVSHSWAAEETDTILPEGRINLKKRSCATKKIYHQMCKNLVQEKFKGVEEVVKLRRNIILCKWLLFSGAINVKILP